MIYRKARSVGLPLLAGCLKKSIPSSNLSLCVSTKIHRELLLNWFHTKGLVALGAVEGLNNKKKVTSRKAYGFRSFEVLKIALYQTLGDFMSLKPSTDSAEELKFCQNWK